MVGNHVQNDAQPAWATSIICRKSFDHRHMRRNARDRFTPSNGTYSAFNSKCKASDPLSGNFNLGLGCNR
jgi:hypothetical protein